MNEAQQDTAPDIEVEAKPAQTEEPQKPATSRALVQANEAGRLVGKNLDEQIVIANMLIKSGTLPKAFKSVPEVLTGMQYAAELGLNPVTGMRQMYWVHGVISIFGDQPKALVDKSGKCVAYEEFVTDRAYKKICFENANLDAEPWAAVVRSKRKGHPEPIESFFTFDDAERAQLTKNPTWSKYRRDMLIYRARARNFKSNFADVLQGIAIAEYDLNELPNARDVQEAQPNADKLAEMLGKEGKTA